MDTACLWTPSPGYTAGQTLEAKCNLAYMAYFFSGKTYNGRISHCLNDGMTFHMFNFLNDYQADCQDMSSWWVKLCNALGLATSVRRIDDPHDDGSEGFWTKPISPVGSFGSTWNAVGWNFHQVGYSGNVFDACLMLKQSSPRVPQDESINGSYKTDLYDPTGTPNDWTVFDAFSLT